MSVAATIKMASREGMQVIIFPDIRKYGAGQPGGEPGNIMM